MPSSHQELKFMDRNEIREYTFIKKEQKCQNDGPPSFNLFGLRNVVMTPELVARVEGLIKNHFYDPLNEISNRLETDASSQYSQLESER